MMWLTFALLAPLSWALVNVVDKVLVEDFIHDARTIVIIEGFIALVVALGVLIFGPLNLPPLWSILGLLIAGFIYYSSTILYYQAMIKTDPAVISIFLQTMPIFTTLWGIIFFDEIYTVIVYAGIVLVILGSIVASLQKGKKLRIDSNVRDVAIKIILPALLLVSINYALQKWSLKYTDARSIFFFTRIGGLTLSVVYLSFGSVRENFLQNILPHLTTKKISTWLIFLLMEGLNLAGIFLVALAFEHGPISLVSAASGVQPIFVGIFSIVVGIAMGRGAKAFGEGMTWRLAISTLVIVVGIYLISLARL